MEFKLDAYCGLYCGACPALLGTRAGTEKQPCHGCKSVQHPERYCATCGIKACARSRGLPFCSECAQLFTCKQMQSFIADEQWPYHRGVLKNLESIHACGPEAWLAAQETRWQCAACGAACSWWDEICPRCGQPVPGYRADL
jgi:hypothetical protein